MHKTNLKTKLKLDTVKNQIVAKVINTDANTVLLRNLAHVQVKDLSIVFYIPTASAETLITNAILHDWHISLDELFVLAMNNTQKFFPAIISPTSSILSSDSLNRLMEWTGFGKNELWHLYHHNDSVISSSYGAISIFYGNMLEKLYKRVRGPFYVLPFDIHSLMIVPKNEERLCALQRFVYSLSLMTPSADLLSDSVYEFDGEKFNIAEYE